MELAWNPYQIISSLTCQIFYENRITGKLRDSETQIQEQTRYLKCTCQANLIFILLHKFPMLPPICPSCNRQQLRQKTIVSCYVANLPAVNICTGAHSNTQSHWQTPCLLTVTFKCKFVSHRSCELELQN